MKEQKRSILSPEVIPAIILAVATIFAAFIVIFPQLRQWPRLSFSPEPEEGQPVRKTVGIESRERNTSHIVYADDLGVGWDNWSWDCACKFKSSSQVHSGNYAIAVTLQPWGGLAFAYRQGFKTAGYGALEFYINGDEIGEQRLRVFVNDRIGDGIRNVVSLNNPQYIPEGIISANTWKKVSIPLADLDAENITILKVNIVDNTGTPLPTFYIDDVIFSQKTQPREEGIRSPRLPLPPPAKEFRGNVRLTSHKTGDRLPHAVSVRGSYSNVSPALEIWVLVYPHDSKRYYPQAIDACSAEPAEKLGTIWGDVPVYLGRGPEFDVGKRFDIVVVLADNPASLFFRDTLRNWCERSSYPGILPKDLPAGIMEKDSITVTRIAG